MPADPTHPNQLHGEARFRADLVAYLDSLPIGELAELLPDGYKLLPRRMACTRACTSGPAPGCWAANSWRCGS
jgi:hypothetical protein